MGGLLLLSLLALPLLPAAAAAQGSHVRFEPWGGALWDAYRNERGSGNPAWIAAARLGWELGAGLAAPGRGWRITGEVARAEAAEAGVVTLEDTLTVGYRTEWWLATAGVEWDAISGWTGLTLEGAAGAAWIEREIVGGDPIPPGTGGTSEQAEPTRFPALVLGLSAFRHLTQQVQLRVRVQSVVTDPFDELEHSPAIGLGVRFVFD